MSLSRKCHTLTFEEAVVLYGVTVGAQPSSDERKEFDSLKKKGMVEVVDIETRGKPLPAKEIFEPSGVIKKTGAERLVSRAASVTEEIEYNGNVATLYLQASLAGRDCLSPPPEVVDCLQKSGVYVEDAPRKIFDRYTPDWAQHPHFQKCWEKIERQESRK